MQYAAAGRSWAYHVSTSCLSKCHDVMIQLMLTVLNKLLV